ncbi:DUF1642 domain-containing protein [Streptococcus infantis]|uniref:DUF1642 domain-containing protein n=1 Tax=Streptococcus infantis TaxID=68892 RepID=UPI0020569B5C|nr:MAG TPA: Protein of unknown function (DUF1642) [Caudoviricetes sp.]
MTKQELIERIEGLKNIFGNECEYVKIDFVIELASELDELEKVKIPQFVADWYEEHKDNLEYNIWDWMKYNLEPKKQENVIFSQWLGKTVNKPVETLIKMKLYGYEVEKEKRYLVKLKGLGHEFRVLKYNIFYNDWFTGSDREDSSFKLRHTRKELEEAGFGWVFDCPGIEIEEVEKELNNDQ